MARLCQYLIIYLISTTSLNSLPQIEKYVIINNRIIDKYGRENYFHGLNAVWKSAPYLPVTDHFDPNLSFSKEDMQYFNSWGLNVVRLGVMWPGVSPTNNSYNMTYIQNVRKLIQTAYNKYNISTIVDCHEDVLSAAFCGEGAPLWATIPNDWNFPEPVTQWNISNSNHIPSKEQCSQYNWPTYGQTYACASSFQHIYDNYNGLRDSFADHFGILAKQLYNVSGIIGFELFNEPGVGDYFTYPQLKIPAVTDRVNLQPFYDAIAPKIYGNDSDRIIMFEPPTYLDVTMNSSWTEIGFTHVPGGVQYSNKSIFAFHYYANSVSRDQYFYDRTYDGYVILNATSFLTEFGVVQSHHMSETLDYCDQYLISWSGWTYKIFDGVLPNGICTGCDHGVWGSDGHLRTGVVKDLARTYAQKVAGKTILMKFDWANEGNFTLVYEMNTNIVEPTVIYTSLEFWYTKGFDLQILPVNIVTFKMYGNFIEIYNVDDDKYNGETLTVTITPRG
eukprot:261739_1